MTVDHEFLEEVVQKELGFDSLDEFVKRQAHTIFSQKLAACEAIIARFEAKYGMTLATFQQRVINQKDSTLEPFGIIEKEDDLMEWEFEDHGLHYLRERVAQLAA